MASTFHCQDYNLNYDRDVYEAQMQLMLITDPRGHRILHQSHSFTKTGEHVVSVSWIEEDEDDSRPEEY